MCQIHFNNKVAAYYKADPTGAATIKRAYETDLYKRFNLLKRKIRKYIVTDNLLDIRANVKTNYDFETSDQRVEAFLLWLQKQVDAGVLELHQGIEQTVASGKWWGDQYVKSGYKKGAEQLEKNTNRVLGVSLFDISQIGLLVFSPYHLDRLAILYTRNYDNLAGITKEMSDQIAEILAEGVALGKNPNKLAATITNRVDKIGITRARILARTEIMHAHAEASLNMLESLGFEDAFLQSEYLTAHDLRVCPICAPFDNKKFKVDDARGIIPQHPQCRCIWLPYFPDLKNDEKDDFVMINKMKANLRSLKKLPHRSVLLQVQ